MDDAFLPIDVCETIIDHCEFRQDFEENPGENYETLRACALVCSAWLPRSRRHLLREVRLRNFDDVDLLLKLLKEHPPLADLVTAIYITQHQYVPFARFSLSGGLGYCHHLAINPETWSTIYPPAYSRWISGFQTLTELALGISGLSAPEIFHIVWSLPLLSSLILLESHGNSSRLERFGGQLSPRLNAKGKLERCRELRHLTVNTSSSSSSLLSTAGFPPSGAFGSSITHLDLRLSLGVVISESFLECLDGFSNLESLAIAVGPVSASMRLSLSLSHLQRVRLRDSSAGPTFHDSFPTRMPQFNHSKAPVLQVVPHIQSGHHLRELRLSLYPRDILFEGYEQSCTSFLEVLCGATMQQALTRLPLIQAFVVTIKMDDEEHDRQWWTEQIEHRLPMLPRGALQIDLHPSSKFSSEPSERTNWE